MADTSQLDAHMYLLKKIIGNKKINMSEAALFLGKSTRQTQRYLKELSPLFEHPIDTNNKKEWVIPKFILDVRLYKVEDLVVINALLTKVEKDNHALYNKAIEMFEILSEKASHVVFKQSSIENIMVQYKNEFYLIKEAIENIVEIEFNYYSDKYPKHVQPLKIANLEQYWYLLCFDLKENKFCKYHFSGLKDIKLLSITFDMNEHKYTKKINNAINAYFNLEDDNEVQLKLSKVARKVLSRKKLNETQNIYKNGNDEYIMEITVSHLMEISPLVQQWIPHIEVLYPIELKNIIKENLKNYNI